MSQIVENPSYRTGEQQTQPEFQAPQEAVTFIPTRDRKGNIISFRYSVIPGARLTESDLTEIREFLTFINDVSTSEQDIPMPKPFDEVAKLNLAEEEKGVADVLLATSEAIGYQFRIIRDSKEPTRRELRELKKDVHETRIEVVKSASSWEASAINEILKTGGSQRLPEHITGPLAIITAMGVGMSGTDATTLASIRNQTSVVDEIPAHPQEKEGSSVSIRMSVQALRQALSNTHNQEIRPQQRGVVDNPNQNSQAQEVQTQQENPTIAPTAIPEVVAVQETQLFTPFDKVITDLDVDFSKVDTSSSDFLNMIQERSNDFRNYRLELSNIQKVIASQNGGAPEDYLPLFSFDRLNGQNTVSTSFTHKQLDGSTTFFAFNEGVATNGQKLITTISFNIPAGEGYQVGYATLSQPGSPDRKVIYAKDATGAVYLLTSNRDWVQASASPEASVTLGQATSIPGINLSGEPTSNAPDVSIVATALPGQEAAIAPTAAPTEAAPNLEGVAMAPDQRILNLDNYNGTPWPDESVRFNLHNNVTYEGDQIIITNSDGTSEGYKISPNGIPDQINARDWGQDKSLYVIGTFLGFLGTRNIQNIQIANPSNGSPIDFLSFPQITVVDVAMSTYINGRQTTLIVSVPMPDNKINYASGSEFPQPTPAVTALAQFQPGVKTQVGLLLLKVSPDNLITGSIIPNTPHDAPIAARQNLALVLTNYGQYGTNLEALSTNSANGIINAGSSLDIRRMV